MCSAYCTPMTYGSPVVGSIQKFGASWALDIKAVMTLRTTSVCVNCKRAAAVRSTVMLLPLRGTAPRPARAMAVLGDLCDARAGDRALHRGDAAGLAGVQGRERHGTPGRVRRLLSDPGPGGPAHRVRQIRHDRAVGPDPRAPAAGCRGHHPRRRHRLPRAYPRADPPAPG